MKRFPIGSKLLVDEKFYKVIGYIVYTNPENDNEQWIEYRMLSERNEETWLSIDDINEEYSLSWPTGLESNQISAKWHKVDEGSQIVQSFEGDVDVELGETSEFIEHEDDDEEKILSVEIWEEGSEISEGFYLDEDEIAEVSNNNSSANTGISYGQHAQENQGCGAKVKGCLSTAIFFLVFLFGAGAISGGMDMLFSSSTPCKDFISSSLDYTYVTSITGENDLKADVYEATFNETSENLRDVQAMEYEMASTNELHADASSTKTDAWMSLYVKDLIAHAGVNPEYVTENTETGDSVGVLTKNEYCLFYHPEDDPNKIYVQVSDRKYNYSSRTRPYMAAAATNMWYRNHYYSSAYSVDSSKFSDIPSSYNMHQGPIVKDLGNGYFDVYSNDVKNSSAGMSRRSSSGGHSAGK